MFWGILGTFYLLIRGGGQKILDAFSRGGKNYRRLFSSDFAKGGGQKFLFFGPGGAQFSDVSLLKGGAKREFRWSTISDTPECQIKEM